jgi:hypothetical protein
MTFMQTPHHQHSGMSNECSLVGAFSVSGFGQARAFTSVGCYDCCPGKLRCVDCGQYRWSDITIWLEYGHESEGSVLIYTSGPSLASAPLAVVGEGRCFQRGCIPFMTPNGQPTQFALPLLKLISHILTPLSTALIIATLSFLRRSLYDFSIRCFT